MACTTLLVGSKVSYDGSLMIARNDDAPAGKYMPKRFTVVEPEDQPREYTSVISHVTIPLPDDPVRYTAMPNAVEGEGIWAGCGVNDYNVGMTATETITSNPRVQGADPLVVYKEATEETPEVPGGIGEEDMVVLVLPYIKTAREGVLRLGSLLEQYGTYEMNGIAFCDSEEIWFLETIGGHHWIARRVPDDVYVVMPNQQGIDSFDFDDAFGAKKENLCSSDMREFIRDNHLDLTLAGDFDVRAAFGSRDDADKVYNTPRAWYIHRYFNPSMDWDGPDADMRPEDFDLPWCMTPDRKITPEDVKYALSGCYQGTPFDPYSQPAHGPNMAKYRPIGINRTDFFGFVQIRPYMPEELKGIEWIAYGSNAFNVMIPQYTWVDETCDYLSETDGTVTTESFYWTSRIIAALADAQYKANSSNIERYRVAVDNGCRELLNKWDKRVLDSQKENRDENARWLLEEANREITEFVRKKTEETLFNVLNETSNHMKNAFARSDA
ncbi:MAG: C69 family dipeptidase [Eubacterium sp.]|nr:C69 family dipeptidase [Eubacterium sp.]